MDCHVNVFQKLSLLQTNRLHFHWQTLFPKILFFIFFEFQCWQMTMGVYQKGNRRNTSFSIIWSQTKSIRPQMQDIAGSKLTGRLLVPKWIVMKTSLYWRKRSQGKEMHNQDRKNLVSPKNSIQQQKQGSCHSDMQYTKLWIKNTWSEISFIEKILIIKKSYFPNCKDRPSLLRCHL